MAESLSIAATPTYKCPCGEQARIAMYKRPHGKARWQIRCEGCGRQTGLEEDPDRVIAIWRGLPQGGA